MWKIMEKEMSKDISQISGIGHLVIDSIINGDNSRRCWFKIKMSSVLDMWTLK